MKIRISSPTKAFLSDYSQLERLELVKLLSYSNTAAAFLVKRHANNHFWRGRNPESWEAKYQELKNNVNTTLIFEENGQEFIRPGTIPYIEGHFNVEITNEVSYPIPKPVPWAKELPFDLYPYQDESVKKLIAERHGNVELCTGCHKAGQGIIMFDGSIKKVEDIKVNDLLMGPDSKPRKVLRLCFGKQEMAKIVPTKGKSFTINMDHVLSLVKTNNKSSYRIDRKKRRKDWAGAGGRVVNISVRDYLLKSDSFKHRHKLYRAGVDFPKSELPIDPYILGSWLGDGSTADTAITSMDKEILDYWENYAFSLGHKIRIETKLNTKAVTLHIHNNGQNILKNKFKALGILGNKHIPHNFLCSSRDDRLQILAGLIDTDGSLSNGTYDYISVLESLTNEVAYLATSLGFSANIKECKKKSQNQYEGTYWRLCISGDISQIPVKLTHKRASARSQIKSHKRTGFKVELLPEDDFYGFELDSDSLYLLDDFTVTHNSGKSAIILKLCRETGFRTAIIVPSKNIFLELVKKFEHHFGKGQVGKFGNGTKKIGKRFTICIGDSLTNVKRDTPEWEFFSGLDMLITDESHVFGAETLEEVCHGVLSNIPYRLFCSGTQTRGDGSYKLLCSIIGKTVVSLGTAEAVAGGYISPHDYSIVRIPSGNPNYQSSDALEMKRVHFLNNRFILEFAAKLANSVWRAKKEQTLILVDELSQVSVLAKLLTVPFALAHSESKKDRLQELGLEKVNPEESVEKFNKGEVRVLVGTSCIGTGTNIFPVNHCVNLQGGASEIKTKQGAVGRSVRFMAANPFKNDCAIKTKAVIWDFDVEGIKVMEQHLKRRIGFYEQSGSEIRYIKI